MDRICLQGCFLYYYDDSFNETRTASIFIHEFCMNVSLNSLSNRKDCNEDEYLLLFSEKVSIMIPIDAEHGHVEIV